MRLFQNSGLYPTYLARLDELARNAGAQNFSERKNIFLRDRFGASHFLDPVLSGDPGTFFTNGDDEVLQRSWAREHGMPASSLLNDILLAQIESHRTEVFYNLDPMRYGSDFVRRLPGCVRRSIAWRAAPFGNADFSAYSLMVCNFPRILKSFEDRGWKAARLFPAHDPQLDEFAANNQRPVDVMFAGGYTRHHSRRAALLEGLAAKAGRLEINLYLDASRATRLAEAIPFRWLPLPRHQRPTSIKRIAQPPVMGVGLYDAMSRARIILNGAIDIAGEDRGNMRCFEAMGARCLLISDEGNYPEGMTSGQTMLTYKTVEEAVGLIDEMARSPRDLRAIAQRGYDMVRTTYTKQAQWVTFQRLAG